MVLPRHAHDAVKPSIRSTAEGSGAGCVARRCVWLAAHPHTLLSWSGQGLGQSAGHAPSHIAGPCMTTTRIVARYMRAAGVREEGKPTRSGLWHVLMKGGRGSMWEVALSVQCRDPECTKQVHASAFLSTLWGPLCCGSLCMRCSACNAGVRPSCPRVHDSIVLRTWRYYVSAIAKVLNSCYAGL